MPEPLPPHDPDTGEILDGTLAADGGRRIPAANTLGEFLRMLEDGQFDADVAFDLKELAADMENLAIAGGNRKLDAELTIKVKISRTDDGLYFFAASHAIKRPKEVRPRSVGWLTDDHRFTPNKPHQGNLFGTVRDVTARRDVRG